MSDDICNAIDWVGCITNSKDHAHDIRMKAHKELNKLRAERENLQKELFNYKHHSEQHLIALREAESELREEKETVANLRAENEMLREALKPFANATVIDLTHNGENFVKAVVASEDNILCARTILEGATK